MIKSLFQNRKRYGGMRDATGVLIDPFGGQEDVSKP